MRRESRSHLTQHTLLATRPEGLYVDPIFAASHEDATALEKLHQPTARVGSGIGLAGQHWAEFGSVEESRHATPSSLRHDGSLYTPSASRHAGNLYSPNSSRHGGTAYPDETRNKTRDASRHAGNLYSPNTSRHAGTAYPDETRNKSRGDSRDDGAAHLAAHGTSCSVRAVKGTEGATSPRAIQAKWVTDIEAGRAAVSPHCEITARPVSSTSNASTAEQHLPSAASGTLDAGAAGELPSSIDAASARNLLGAVRARGGRRRWGRKTCSERLAPSGPRAAALPTPVLPSAALCVDRTAFHTSPRATASRLR